MNRTFKTFKDLLDAPQPASDTILSWDKAGNLVNIDKVKTLNNEYLIVIDDAIVWWCWFIDNPTAVSQG